MDRFEERYKSLNREQKRVVDAIEGPVLVVAGPGSGKTEVLGLRVANILRRTDVSPGNILCLTFTDSAAANMRERLKELMGHDAYKVAIHTFHNFGVDIINYHPEIFYQGAIFSSADELTQLDLLGEIFSGLEHDNPLRETHPEQGYTYLRSAKDAIQYLKRAGLTPEEFRSVLDHNEKSLEFLNPVLGDCFKGRVSKGMFGIIPGIIEKIRSEKMEDFPISHMESLSSAIAGSLERALEKAGRDNEAKPLSGRKKEMMYKGDGGEYLLKETKYLEKMRALSGVYEKYRKLMHERGYYDFDDMILDTVTAVEENDELRYELEEQFQYILVDEFQDTNDAQMRLLNLLTSAEVHEGRPNIMAVGDDDQAIFKFQGAKISNIMKFKDRYREPEIITLTKNYRSRQDILEVARYVITQGDERLENIIPDVNKVLESVNDGIAEGKITSRAFATKEREYQWVAGEIRKLVDNGLDPKNIGVIARKHRSLKSLFPYLERMGIPVLYEARRNVLEEPYIRQLVQIARFAASLLKSYAAESDDLLPEILSYPFWGIDREAIWRISREAYEKKKPWLEVMLRHGNGRVREVARFLLDLSAMSKYEPVDRVLDMMVGARMHVLPESEDEEMEGEKNDEESEFVSPFKDYYFSPEKFKENPAEYLVFLSGLRTFVYALRGYKEGRMIGLEDMINFVDMHEKSNMVLSDNGTFSESRNAVNLLTAHKAKGLEFDTVFVLNCDDGVWAGKKKGSRLPFPVNLPVTPAGDDRDDQLRLFYVAVTRAARELYLTSYELDDSGKEIPRLQFISSPVSDENGVRKFLEPEKEIVAKETEVEEFPVFSWESRHQPPFQGDEKSLLKSVLENYKLNVTHMNNFLDVAGGGPQIFLEQNLLRFPQPKSVFLSYGTAMHGTVNRIYGHLKKTGSLPGEEEVMIWFRKFLENERLGEKDFKPYLERGRQALKTFFEKKKGEFSPDHLSEFNFYQEGVVIEGVPITGKIDKMEVKDGEIVVYDFKTGKCAEEWKGKSKHEKIKLWKYRNQLVFYKLLVENSRRFGDDYEVKKGVIEFLEPKNKNEIVSLPLVIEPGEVERFKKLVKAVYERIMNLDFPETDGYPDDLEGIKKFEEDLIVV